MRLKFHFNQDEPAQRYRTLLFKILERVAAATSKSSVGWSDFALDASPGLERLEQSVFELSRLIANLAAIDGAVVVDKRFALVGCGAEVSSELSSPPRVWRALDTEGIEREIDDIENVGTRHRAAYRFVHDHPQGLAIVISHDGGVSFVANRDGEVVFWGNSRSARNDARAPAPGRARLRVCPRPEIAASVMSTILFEGIGARNDAAKPRQRKAAPKPRPRRR